MREFGGASNQDIGGDLIGPSYTWRVKRVIRAAAGIGLATLAACAASGQPGDGIAAGSAPVALTNVRLIDGRGGPPRDGTTIVFSLGRIQAVGPSSTTPIPQGVRVLDLGGRTVTPGFIDMHFHVTTGAMRYRRTASGALDSTYDRALAERLLRVALAHGITTIRDPGASPMRPGLALRADVARGAVVGPRIYTAGTILSRGCMSEAEIRAAVREQAAAGVDFIKVYSALSSAQVGIAADEAHRHGLEVIGHLQRASWTEAARAGIDFITHGANWNESYLPPARRAAFLEINDMRQRIAWYEDLDLAGAAVDTLLAELVAHRVSIDPTLVAYHTKFWWRDSIYQRDPDVAIVPEALENWKVIGMHTAGWSRSDFDRVQAAWPKQLALVRLLYRRGVMLTAGSDFASPWVIPGVAFHQELALLESAGLSAAQVLEIATRNGAIALGIDADVGTVESGKWADLVVLAADPLADIRNTRRIEYVVRRGALYRPEALLDSSRAR